MNEQVGTSTVNLVPKWDGSALVPGSIFDNGRVGSGTTNPGMDLEVHPTIGGGGINIKSSALIFGTNNTGRMFIDNTGKAGLYVRNHNKISRQE